MFELINLVLERGISETVKDLVIGTLADIDDKRMKKEIQNEKRNAITSISCDHSKAKTLYYRRGVIIGYICNSCDKLIKGSP